MFFNNLFRFILGLIEQAVCNFFSKFSAQGLHAASHSLKLRLILSPIDHIVERLPDDGGSVNALYLQLWQAADKHAQIVLRFPE